ncbi:protein of unknown function [Thermococcus camini]|uniref:Uncharacterized protein n=1 Tax=Thermococcus camini TaxID=2016373 RepID=A0A7G2D8Y0_9EURY|nr:protein of unknown function [Thermococcus camini]
MLYHRSHFSVSIVRFCQVQLTFWCVVILHIATKSDDDAANTEIILFKIERFIC